MAYARIFDKGDYYENNPGFGRVAVEEKKEDTITEKNW